MLLAVTRPSRGRRCLGEGEEKSNGMGTSEPEAGRGSIRGIEERGGERSLLMNRIYGFRYPEDRELDMGFQSRIPAWIDRVFVMAIMARPASIVINHAASSFILFFRGSWRRTAVCNAGQEQPSIIDRDTEHRYRVLELGTPHPTNN